MAGGSIQPIGEPDWQELLNSTPEALQDNPLVLFFRCRYDLRDGLKLRFNEAERERVRLEIERVDTLRSSFNQDVENNTLIRSLDHSRKAWREHAINRCQDEIRKVEKKRDDATPSVKPRYVRELRILRAVKRWKISADPLRPNTSLPEDKGYGFIVYMITLKKDPAVKGSGRNSYNKYSEKPYRLQDILYNKKDNPLMEKCEENTIRYFHFPANNMIWVEEAIGLYYGEETGEYNYRKAKNYRKMSSNLLCREYWTAQQHGSISEPIHARHMRAHCSYISSAQDSTNNGVATSNDGNATTSNDSATTNGNIATGTSSAAITSSDSKNFIIFMPYLHWEMDKRRRKMADITKQVAREHQKRRRKKLPQELREELTEAIEKARIKYGSRKPSEPITKKVQLKNQDLRPLAKYLFHVARVYDAMDIEPDVRLLHDHLLPSDGPPLHGRRTLDQSYHWKLENTDRRDEDQVVYRGTKAGKSINRTTRVVMVDQLWLYVLDDNTILSFFPRRWGRNKPDSSGVHRSIRARLEHVTADEVQSVYDLALIIMHQCSTVFFDRTKPADARPQVLDIFANAIAHVSEMKTNAFETFWRNLDKLRLHDIHKKDIEAIEEAARVYLDVNPEGTLLREAHDIIDELRMMARIFSQQLSVSKHFAKTLQGLNEQESPLSPIEILQGLKKTLEDISSRQTGVGVDSDTHLVIPQNVEAVPGKKRPIPDSTLYRAKNLLEDIEMRINELQDFENNTREISDHLKDLLGLKQQQASIIEAKAALARADESVTQGRAIMVFTIITIIFLPLSFMSSIFGMNAQELSGPSGGVMSLRYQFTFMFPISIAVIIVSLALAFSNWIRNFISFLASIMWAVLIEYTGLRQVWIFCIQKYDAKGLYQSKQRYTRNIYERHTRNENRRALKMARNQERLEAGGTSGRAKREGSPVQRRRLGWPRRPVPNGIV